MFLFSRKKSLIETNVFKGMTDYHSHILPGVDDGIRKMDEALEVLSYFETLGITTLWCTPHIMEDIPNTTEDLRKRFAELQAAYQGPIKLYLSAENMMDSLFEERLKANDVLPIGPDGDCLLVETSYFNPPANMRETIESVKSAGYFPVLAHPERYEYMTTDDYRKWYSRNVSFQLNVTSLTGAYGPHVKKKAEWLLKNGMYSYRGTDIHSLPHFKQRIQTKIKIDENQL